LNPPACVYVLNNGIWPELYPTMPSPVSALTNSVAMADTNTFVYGSANFSSP